MQVVQMLLIDEGGKQGYLAVTDKADRVGNREAIKYIGTKFGSGFMPGAIGAGLSVKTVRSAKEFAKYVKMFNPGAWVDPVQVGGVVFDLPFVHFGNGLMIRWQPYFEKTVSESSFSLVSGGSIIEYTYQQPIYISALHMRRHMAAANSERLLINVNNGYTTRELSAVENSQYCEVTSHVENGEWVRDKLSKLPIAGYKLR